MIEINYSLLIRCAFLVKIYEFPYVKQVNLSLRKPSLASNIFFKNCSDNIWRCDILNDLDESKQYLKISKDKNKEPDSRSTENLIDWSLGY